MSLYNTGLLIGRYQMFHKGHEADIRKALTCCNRVVVFIGSSQESRTKKNPFNIEERIEMITRIFPEDVENKRLILLPLPDAGVGDNEDWGQYVLDEFVKNFGEQPNLYITGCEKERASWFSDKIAPYMDELRIMRGSINISGTQCRQYLLNNDKGSWMNCVSDKLFDSYEKYRRILLDVEFNNVY